MKHLYDTLPLSIAYDSVHQWLYVEWRGKHDANSAKTGSELILRHLQNRPCRKMLNDNSQVTSDWEGGARWAGSENYGSSPSRAYNSWPGFVCRTGRPENPWIRPCSSSSGLWSSWLMV